MTQIKKENVEMQIYQWLIDEAFSESVSECYSSRVVSRKKMKAFGYVWISDNKIKSN